MKHLFVVALVLNVGLIAQDMPLPEALITAKTAAVVNAGVDQNVYERLVLELQGWKRWTLEEDPSTADITITVAAENVVSSNPVTGHAGRGVVYRLSFKKGETVLYSDALKGCCSLKAMTQKTLERLGKRLDKQGR